jgi:predicted ATP-dependent protease
LIEASALLQSTDVRHALKRALARGETGWEIAPGAVMPVVGITPIRCQVMLLATRDEADQLLNGECDLTPLRLHLVEMVRQHPLAPDRVGTMVAHLKQRLAPMITTAVTPQAWAAAIEYQLRQNEDQHRFSLDCESVLSLLRLAVTLSIERGSAAGVERQDFIAARRVSEQHLMQAQMRIAEDMAAGLLSVDLATPMVGQATGVSLVDLCGDSLCLPMKVSASIRQGEGKVVDIEREADIGGEIHSKGVLTLAAYLGSAFAPTKPFAVLCHLTCEQCTEGIDGDSASAAELAALLSALAHLPLDPSIAVTGAMTQHGNILTVGGINEKINGFFAVCQQLAPSRSHGIVIPEANLSMLMLDDDVCNAVDAGHFRIYAVNHIADLMPVLTGVPWQSSTPQGLFQSVLHRLEVFEKSAREEPRPHWSRPLRER